MAGKPIGEEFEWLNKLVSRAFEDFTPLTNFQVDFIMRLAPRLDRYKERTLVSPRERRVIDDVERRLDEDGQEEAKE